MVATVAINSFPWLTAVTKIMGTVYKVDLVFRKPNPIHWKFRIC